MEAAIPGIRITPDRTASLQSIVSAGGHRSSAYRRDAGSGLRASRARFRRAGYRDDFCCVRTAPLFGICGPIGGHSDRRRRLPPRNCAGSEPLRRCPEDEPGTIVVRVYVAVDLAPYAHGDDESVAANAALMRLDPLVDDRYLAPASDRLGRADLPLGALAQVALQSARGPSVDAGNSEDRI
jgi:hypothetical protein